MTTTFDESQGAANAMYDLCLRLTGDGTAAAEAYTIEMSKYYSQFPRFDRSHFEAMLSARAQRADLVPVEESQQQMAAGMVEARRLIERGAVYIPANAETGERRAERYHTMTRSEFEAMVGEEIAAQRVIDDEYEFGREMA